jgi:hypothetical protein
MDKKELKVGNTIDGLKIKEVHKNMGLTEYIVVFNDGSFKIYKFENERIV